MPTIPIEIQRKILNYMRDIGSDVLHKTRFHGVLQVFDTFNNNRLYYTKDIGGWNAPVYSLLVTSVMHAEWSLKYNPLEDEDTPFDRYINMMEERMVRRGIMKLERGSNGLIPICNHPGAPSIAP
jgi:hypothetical protein